MESFCWKCPSPCSEETTWLQCLFRKQTEFINTSLSEHQYFLLLSFIYIDFKFPLFLYILIPDLYIKFIISFYRLFSSFSSFFQTDPFQTPPKVFWTPVHWQRMPYCTDLCFLESSEIFHGTLPVLISSLHCSLWNNLMIILIDPAWKSSIQDYWRQWPYQQTQFREETP